MFTVKLSHVARTRNVFFDPHHGERQPERYIDAIEKINTTPAIILAKGLREALFMNRPVVKDIVFSLCNFGSGPIYGIDEAKIHSLDEPAVQDILVQLSNSQE